jgi:hypothetical protein
MIAAAAYTGYVNKRFAELTLNASANLPLA